MSAYVCINSADLSNYTKHANHIFTPGLLTTHTRIKSCYNYSRKERHLLDMCLGVMWPHIHMSETVYCKDRKVIDSFAEMVKRVTELQTISYQTVDST